MDSKLFHNVTLKEFNKATKEMVRLMETSPGQMVAVYSSERPVAILVSPPLLLEFMRGFVQEEPEGGEPVEAKIYEPETDTESGAELDQEPAKEG